jgi:hypothetical protein
VLVVGPLIAREGATGRDGSFLQRMAMTDSQLHGHLWPMIATVATFAIALNGGRVGSNQIMDAHFNPERMPVAAVDFLESHGITGPVLSPDAWGGYLIYRHIPVVVDDRHDMYGEEFFKSYLKMIHVEPGWQEFLQAHPASCVILPRNAALASVLAEASGWKSIYSDDVAIAFAPQALR